MTRTMGMPFPVSRSEKLTAVLPPSKLPERRFGVAMTKALGSGLEFLVKLEKGDGEEGEGKRLCKCCCFSW